MIVRFQVLEVNALPCVIVTDMGGRLWMRRLDRPLDDPREWIEVAPPPPLTADAPEGTHRPDAAAAGHDFAPLTAAPHLCSVCGRTKYSHSATAFLLGETGA